MIDTPTEQIAVGIGTIGGVLLMLQKIWRALRREQVDAHKDGAEINMMRLLREQNAELIARADRAFDERNRAMEELGRLRAEVTALRHQCDRMEREIEALRQRG